MKWTIHKLTVADGMTPHRLDQFLADSNVDLSRTFVRKIIDLGGVHLNGRRVRNCSTQVKVGDRVEVYIDNLPVKPYRLRDEDVVFRDRYLIVLNKPAQIDTQPTHARYKGTLYEALLLLLQDPYRRQQKPSLGMIQRLDRGTSGLIAFSIHPRAHKKMTEIFLEHQVEKRYLALVAGVPEASCGEICSLLARSRKDNRVKTVAKGGKQAITRYRVLEDWQSASLLDIELLTGRMHQIRAHMSELGHPLLGDVRYGGSAKFDPFVFERPLLHAQQLRFEHPVTEEKLDFSAPIPADMNNLITELKNRT